MAAAAHLRHVAAVPMTLPWWGRTAAGKDKINEKIAELELELSEERRLLREHHIANAERHALEASRDVAGSSTLEEAQSKRDAARTGGSISHCTVATTRATVAA